MHWWLLNTTIGSRGGSLETVEMWEHGLTIPGTFVHMCDPCAVVADRSTTGLFFRAGQNANVPAGACRVPTGGR